ncbi:MAG: hypothetical protein WB762_15675 [Candidatus Sulfotelmatobacter sp.]
MKRIGLLLVFAAALSFAQSPAAPAEPTALPPKPTCVIILRNGACADLWRNYNQAVAQRLGEKIKNYADRQAELEAAPLQQQVADLTKLTTDEQAHIKSLQEQIQADSAAAHREGLEDGSAMGAGVTLVLFGLIFGIRRLTRNFTITKKPQARAASAG